MGFIVKAVKSVVKAVVGIATKLVGGIFGFLVGGKKSPKSKSVNTLTKSLEPETARKICFGRIAVPLDLRFWEVFGTQGEYYAEVLAHATHRITAFRELYLEQNLAIDASGTVQSAYVGVITRNTRLGIPGQTGFVVGSGSQWNTSSTFDGCAYSVLTWRPDEKKLPNGIPSRYTQICDCAPVYDPRRDSTMGGSGTHRYNDQSTWDYATVDSNGIPIGRNNALQALWYLLGWRIANPTTGEMVLVAGRGVDVTDINMASFIAGANNCEVAGYYTDLVLSTEDSHTTNENKITCNGLIARLIDPGGLWSYYANVNDTGNVAVTLTDDDILDQGSVQWTPSKGMSDQFNQVVGKFINPSSVTLYQPFPYPMVRDATYEANLGVKRRAQQDFEQVLDSTLAQRLARLKLNMAQYQGELQATWGPRAIKAQAYSVVRYISVRFGWNKLFRVWRQELTNGQCQMLLTEVDPSIWSAGAVASALAASIGSAGDPLRSINPSNVIITLVPMVGANGDKADGFQIAWAAPPTNIRRTEIRYKLTNTTDWQYTLGPVGRDITSVTSPPLLSGAIYEAQVRHVTFNEIPGAWVYSTISPANTIGQFQIGNTGTVNYAAIAAAGGTATWANVTGTGKPTDYADVTASNYSSGVTGGGPWIFEQSNPLSLTKPQPNLIYDAGLKLNARTWDLAGAWTLGNGPDIGYYAWAGGASGTYIRMGGFVTAIPSSPYTFSCYHGGGNYTGGQFAINWFSGPGGTGTLLRQDTIAYNSAGTGYLRKSASFTSPAGAQSYGFFAQTPTIATGGYFLLFKPKAEYSGIVTSWNDDATFGSRYENGQVIDVLKPAEAGSDITGSHNSVGVTGAGDLLFINKAQLPIGGNALLNADFSRGLYGYFANTQTQVSHYGVDHGVNLNSDYGGKLNVFYSHVNGVGGGAWAVGDFCDALMPRGFASVEGLTYQKTFGLPVKQGDRIYARCLAAQHRCRFELNILIYNKDGGFLGAQAFGGALENGGSNGGDPNLFNVVGGVMDISSSTYASAAHCSLFFRMYGDGRSDPYIFVALPAFGILPAGQTELPVWQPGPPSRILDPQQYNTQLLLGPSNTTNLAPSYTVNSTNVTVNFPAHVRTIAGINGPVSLNYGACSAVWPFSSYWVAYIDDTDLTGVATPAVVLTSSPNDLLYPGRYQIGSGTTPASGGGGGSVGGGGGFSDSCVCYDSYLPDGRKAYQVYAGTMIEIVNETLDDVCSIDVTRNYLADSECVKLTSISGIELICSVTTPITLEDGRGIYAPACQGRRLPVKDENGFRWELIETVEHVGIMTVAHISCHNKVYGAGSQPGRFIYTHNPTVPNPKP